MTRQQAAIVNTLAKMYIQLGRLDRGMLLAGLALRYAQDDTHPRRILARGYLAKGQPEDVLAQINRLIEKEFNSEELAFALHLQSLALFQQGNRIEARQVWKQFVTHCHNAGLRPQAFSE